MINNQVDIVTVGSLLNGKNHFYIPSYQRGYRWNKKQVEDLLSDLYSFNRQYHLKKTDGIGDFYCLQPVVVREITDSTIRELVLVEKAQNQEHKLWELVDGQQRLTSIFIILLNLLNKLQLDEQGFEDWYGAQLYTLYYESRPHTADILKSLLKSEETDINNIEATHIVNANHYINEWFKEKGLEISKRYVGGGGEKPKVMWSNLIEQLVCDTDAGSTKVIWYQLSNDESVDPVQEFTRINNGKIPLTDTELIKALFLQKKNFGNSKVLQQTKLSMQWEQMENFLQRNDFWCFISDKGVEEEDRMGELLKLVYLRYKPANTTDIELGDIFRYYYNELEGLPLEKLPNKIKDLWGDIIDTFRTLEDWYDSPEIYNYVGYLVQSGVSLYRIYEIFETVKKEKKESTIDDFISKLENEVRNVLPSNWIEKDENNEYKITIRYPNRPDLRKILLLLNVDSMAQQLKAIRQDEKDNEKLTDVNVFKFPFDLYKSQKWDIEHIDSATTNDLTDKNAQQAWVENAIKDAKIEINDKIRRKMDRGEWKDLVGIIQRHEEEDLENKHFIGNLTLLDAGTNREYKNDLFCQKRNKIIERVKNGRYILTCTLFVFMKFFDNNNVTESRTKWTKVDQQKYHHFIIEQLHRFISK